MKTTITLTMLLVFAALQSYAQGWAPLNTGTDNWVTTLAADTTNNILYAGGQFNTADGTSAAYIAQWNGTNWTPVGSGLDYAAHSMAMINGDLYVGGEFTTAGGISANRIAKWDGVNWTAIGTGLFGSVNAIAEFNGEIYVGSFAGFHKWDGVNWTEVGGNVGGTNPYVQALKVYNGKLFVGGTFSSVGGIPTNGIAVWDGASWSVPGGSGLNVDASAYALEVYNGSLYVGGIFTSAGGVSANNLAKWDGVNWSGVASGVSGGVPGYDAAIYTMYVANGELYMGGNFDTAGGTLANYIAGYDGSTFTNLNSGTNERVFTIAEYAGKLIAGGQFLQADGMSVNYIAKWTFAIVGIHESEISQEGVVYPNPFTESAVLSTSRVLNNGELKIFNVSGEFVQGLENISGTKVYIQREQLKQGMYYYQLKEDGQEILTGKLFIAD